MDAVLDQRWTDSQPPFDGCTLVFDEALDKVSGIAIVRFLLTELDSRFALGEKLFVNEDWHIHDGFIKESRTVLKADLQSELATQDETWVRVIDDQVYWGIYDSSYRFYLRFGLEEGKPELLIDLSTDEATVRDLAQKIQALFKVVVHVVNAREYHDSIYGG